VSNVSIATTFGIKPSLFKFPFASKGKSKDFEDKQQLMEQSTVFRTYSIIDYLTVRKVTTNANSVINLCIQR
jgi:hypothetical protein